MHPLKAYRETAGMTQETLASLLGTHQSCVSEWESSGRKIPLSVALRINRLTGINLYEIIAANPIEDHPLVRWRMDNDISQARLAALLGVSDTTVSTWETRRRQPRLAHALAIVELTGIPMGELVRGQVCEREDADDGES